MARKVVSRKDLRREAEAAEKAEATATKKKKKVAKKKATKRKSRSKTAAEVRLRAYWGVFNQSLKMVARFEYNEHKKAQKKAAELTTSQKTPHFVQPVKEEIVEE